MTTTINGQSTRPITIYCGQKFARPYLFSEDEARDVPIDVSGYELRAKLRDMYGVLMLSTASETTGIAGGVGTEIVTAVLSAPGGVMELSIAEEHTAALQTAGFTNGRLTVSVYDGDNEWRIENAIVSADWETTY